MIYTREQIISLRKKLIKFLSESHSEKISKLTDILIEYPTISYCETAIKDIDRKWFTQDWTSTGHGAFGEPEGYSTTSILGWDIFSVNEVFFNSDDAPIRCSDLNLKGLVRDVKIAHNNSFKL
jgi:hypothetical protein